MYRAMKICLDIIRYSPIHFTSPSNITFNNILPFPYSSCWQLQMFSTKPHVYDHCGLQTRILQHCIKKNQPSSHVTAKVCASVAMDFQWSRLQTSLIFPPCREMSSLAYGAIGIKEAYNTRNFTTWKQLQMHIYTLANSSGLIK